MNDNTCKEEVGTAAHSLENHKRGDESDYSNHPKFRFWKQMDEDTQTVLADSLILLEQTPIRSSMNMKDAVYTTQLRSAIEYNRVLAAANDHEDARAKRFQKSMRSLVQVASASQLLTSKMQEIMDDLRHFMRMRYALNKWTKVNLDHIPKDSIMKAFSSKDLANLPTYFAAQDQEAAVMFQILDSYKKMDKLIGSMPAVANHCLSKIRWYVDEHRLARQIFHDFNELGGKFRAFFLPHLSRRFIL